MNAVYNLDSSVTKDLPVFPNGILKQFFLQWTASLYADDKALQKLAESLIPQVNFGSARGVKSGRAGIDAVKGEEHDGGGLVVLDRESVGEAGDGRPGVAGCLRWGVPR